MTSRPAPKPVPGSEGRSVGFDQPFEMLGACHERTRRTLRLLTRLRRHVQDHGPDDSARQAAADVLRYFAIAAPQHHKDEELHIVPLLRASGDPRLVEVADRLVTDHRVIERIWLKLAPCLKEVANGQSPSLAVLASAAAEFGLLHQEHLTLEEALAFPSAAALQNLLGPADLANIGQEMAARRSNLR